MPEYNMIKPKSIIPFEGRHEELPYCLSGNIPPCRKPSDEVART
jgi:hypothetical protein